MQPFLDQRLGRQVAIIDWVAANTDVPVPKVLLADQAGEVMGRPLMVLRHVAGRAPVDYPGYNVAGFLVEMAPDARRRLWEGAMDMLCRLHRADASSIDFLDFPGTARADLPDLLIHWGASLDWAGGDIDQAAFGEVLGWLRREAPTDAPKGLSWGDARPGNMLFDGERCAAVLDWDLASTAGPLVDLSWWLVFDRIQDEDTGVPRLEGLGSRAETLDLWAAATGHSLAHLRWHEVLAHFQLAVTRAKAFGDRRRAGWTVPADDDPRSVLRLQRRIEAILGKDA